MGFLETIFFLAGVFFGLYNLYRLIKIKDKLQGRDTKQVHRNNKLNGKRDSLSIEGKLRIRRVIEKLYPWWTVVLLFTHQGLLALLSLMVEIILIRPITEYVKFNPIAYSLIKFFSYIFRMLTIACMLSNIIEPREDYNLVTSIYNLLR